MPSGKMLSYTFRNLCGRQNAKICATFSVYQKRNRSSRTESGIITSKMPQVVIPNVTLDEYMFEKLEKWPTRTALECSQTGRKYTYSDVLKKSKSLANFLHKFKGLNQGDTIAIVLPNVPEYPIIMLGAVLAGLRVTTVNATYTPHEVAKQLENSRAKIVFTLNGPWYATTTQAIQSLPDKNVAVVVINHKQGETTPSGAIKFNETIDGDHRINFSINRSPDDNIILPYSSGTTGLPKGVQLTHRNIVSNLRQISVEPVSYIFEPEDVVPAILPAYHIYGMVSLNMNTLSYGCKILTMPKFDPELFYSILNNHKPTLSFLVPPLILLLINSPKVTADHLQRMKCICSGAAPLGAADVDRLREKGKTDLNIIQGYGLTETSPTVTVQTDQMPHGIKSGGSGFVVPHTECKIVSTEDEKTILGPNQSGELYVRGPQVMKGYFNNPKATAEVIDSEGWFRTGDIAHFDEHDHIFVTDRLKELIKVKGLQVAPAELEELLRSHPDIDDAAVIGVPHPKHGEEAKAFIVPKKGSQVNTSKIQGFVAEKVSKHKQLTGGVIIVKTIPKSAAGKILRRELRNL